MTPTEDRPPELPEVVDDLLELMRNKRSELRTAVDFPAVCGAARVQAEARRLSVSLQTTHDLRRVLDGVLTKRKEEEKQAGELLARPLAEPMKILLGIAPGTGELGVTARAPDAAGFRSVAPATMINKHQPIIAREFAAYLLEDDAELGQRSVFERVVEAEDFVTALDALSASEARQLAVETVEDSRDFYQSLSTLYSAARYVSQGNSRSWPLEDETLAGLHALAPSHLCSIYWLRYFLDFWEEKEDPDLPSRFRWLLAVLASVQSVIPTFQRREQDLLLHAAAEAGPNLHVFLERLEQSEVGTALIEKWGNLFQPRIDETPPLREAHMGILGALAAAELLIHPSELSKRTEWCIARYVARYGSQGDKARIEAALWKYWKGDSKSGLPRIYDCAADRGFLSSVRRTENIDIYDVALTLEGLVTNYIDKSH